MAAQVIMRHMKRPYRTYREGGNQPQKLITQKQLAAALSVNVQTIRTWKECPRVYIGKRASGTGSACRYDLAEVVVWLKENRRAYQQAPKTWIKSANGKEVQ